MLIKKSFLDLVSDKRRAIISLLAILIGTMSFGIITFSYHIIKRELVSVYDAITPASASLSVNKIDPQLLELTTNFSGIDTFEQRSYCKLRVQTADNKWKTLELFACQDFSSLKMNKITSIKGNFNPGLDELLIERDAIGVANASIGDNITIELPSGIIKTLPITGVVADISLHPASIHDTVYAYVSYDTLETMGLAGNKIDFITTGEKYDRDNILKISNEYIKLLQDNGYIVSGLEISETPGISMHLEEYNSSLFLLQIFSFVMFLFGCMIMSNLISSIISNQTRQIGVLKSFGTATTKIMISYLLSFFVLILATVAISLPFSIQLSVWLSTGLMGIANLRPSSTSISGYLYLLYCCMAMLIPMIIAFFPIKRGVAITVKDALNDYGLHSSHKNTRLIKFTFISRPILLSLRNALRRKNRFILNVITLTLAGALFVSVLISILSIKNTLSANMDAWKFNYQIISGTNYNNGDRELNNIVDSLPNVVSYENWKNSSGMLIYSDGQIRNSYAIVAPPDHSNMFDPEIMADRWINDKDTNQVVVSHKFLATESGYKIGDTIKLQLGNRMSAFTIVGTVKDLGSVVIYMNESTFKNEIPVDHQYTNIKFDLAIKGKRKTIYKNTEQVLKESGLIILQSQSKTDLKNIISGHYNITLQTFLFIAVMLVIVSGFGLAATMNVQTSERRKEIGIMKSMGATKKQIIKIITSESIFIGLLSWLASIFLGIPLSIISVYIFGRVIIDTPLTLALSTFVIAYIIWFTLILLVGYRASSSCAKRAAHKSIRNSLSIE